MRRFDKAAVYLLSGGGKSRDVYLLNKYAHMYLKKPLFDLGFKLNVLDENKALIVYCFSNFGLKLYCVLNSNNVWHGVPKGGQKEKKLSGFGAYIFGIGIPRGLIL